jgi:large subunit ribosomal protein L2
MALKSYNPVTPSQRQLVLVNRSGLHHGAPVKTLTEGKTASGGRNNSGRITVRFRGGGHKKAYRKIDFKRRKFDVPASVERIEYDPNRTAFIALIKYEDGELAYILAPQRLAPGDTVVSGEHADVKPGNAMPIGNVPIGTIVHNVEFKIGKGGAVSNPDNMNVSIGKAGRKRWMGRMPHNRGVSMNPVDHPHGGGEGRTSGGRHPVTPWGFPTKGKKTRRNKSTNKFIIMSRHARKK